MLPGIYDTITKGYPSERLKRHISLFTPIRDEGGSIIAALLLYDFGADHQFSEILSIAVKSPNRFDT